MVMRRAAGTRTNTTWISHAWPSVFFCAGSVGGRGYITGEAITSAHCLCSCQALLAPSPVLTPCPSLWCHDELGRRPQKGRKVNAEGFLDPLLCLPTRWWAFIRVFILTVALLDWRYVGYQIRSGHEVCNTLSKQTQKGWPQGHADSDTSLSHLKVLYQPSESASGKWYCHGKWL